MHLPKNLSTVQAPQHEGYPQEDGHLTISFIFYSKLQAYQAVHYQAKLVNIIGTSIGSL